MLKKMIVKTDGTNYIGRIKKHNPAHFGVRGNRSWKSKKFDEYYYEARYKNVPLKEIPDYIQMRFIEDAEDIINDTIDQKEFEELYKNFQNRLHKRLQRYRDKIFMNEWSYWVTFTYDDSKETAEGFEKRLIIAFNNLAKRYGWRIVGGWENGELGGRLHFHAFVYIPDGKMVGELYARKQYSTKRHRQEIVTDNTFFHERFGNSEWECIAGEDLAGSGRVSYLVKYVVKTGRKLFYSRGITSELEVTVDTDTQVLMSFYHHGVRHILTNVVNILRPLPSFIPDVENTDCEILCFDSEFTGFCTDEDRLVRIYS